MIATQSPRVALVVAAAKNNVIGFKGELPWRLKDDMALFKQVTLGHPVVMGRKTMDALGKPLPGRTNIVVSRTGAISEGFLLAESLSAGVELAKQAPGQELICIIGGGEIYRQSMALADIIYISRVDASPSEGDAHFPEIDSTNWVMEEAIQYEANDRNQFAFSFQTWVRRK